MKSIMRSLLVIILFSLSGNLISQAAIEKLDKVYGLDPMLYNGKKYTFFLPSGTTGHQFLKSKDYFIGEVTLKGETFTNITLNYDILNQQLLLRYTDELGAFNILEVSKAWLESFRLGDMQFVYVDHGEGKRFYQVLGQGKINIFYYWRKDMKLDVRANTGTFDFTPPARDAFVMMDGKLHPYRSKSSLVKIFDPGKKPEIKNYMRTNKIKLKKASDSDMNDLINYIGNLGQNQ